jgi:hypothetical protein
MSGRDEALRRQAEDDDRIYERYGRPLEATHAGQFIAIGRDGRTIVSTDDIEVVRRAIEAFGSGNFVFRRIGHLVIGKWRFLGWS